MPTGEDSVPANRPGRSTGLRPAAARAPQTAGTRYACRQLRRPPELRRSTGRPQHADTHHSGCRPTSHSTSAGTDHAPCRPIVHTFYTNGDLLAFPIAHSRCVTSALVFRGRIGVAAGEGARNDEPALAGRATRAQLSAGRGACVGDGDPKGARPVVRPGIPRANHTARKPRTTRHAEPAQRPHRSRHHENLTAISLTWFGISPRP
jgi:hypothetical protein